MMAANDESKEAPSNELRCDDLVVGAGAAGMAGSAALARRGERRAADGARRNGRAALREQEAEKLSRREERVITLLNKAVEHYAYAKECFEAWQTQRAKSKEAIAAALVEMSEGPDKDMLKGLSTRAPIEAAARTRGFAGLRLRGGGCRAGARRNRRSNAVASTE